MNLHSEIRSQNNASKHNHIGLRKSFVRAIMTSFSATIVDFLVSILLIEYAAIYYVTASTIGGFCGAISSFFMGRIWVFKKKSGKLKSQMLKFIFINSVSIFLNTAGVFFVKEQFDLKFYWSKIIVSIFVGFFFNFLMNRYFVFKS